MTHLVLVSIVVYVQIHSCRPTPPPPPIPTCGKTHAQSSNKCFIIQAGCHSMKARLFISQLLNNCCSQVNSKHRTKVSAPLHVIQSYRACFQVLFLQNRLHCILSKILETTTRCYANLQIINSKKVQLTCKWNRASLFNKYNRKIFHWNLNYVKFWDYSFR